MRDVEFDNLQWWDKTDLLNMFQMPLRTLDTYWSDLAFALEESKLGPLRRAAHCPTDPAAWHMLFMACRFLYTRPTFRKRGKSHTTQRQKHVATSFRQFLLWQESCDATGTLEANGDPHGMTTSKAEWGLARWLVR